MPYRPLDKFPRSDKNCTVYLLHFSEPFGHARHYIGVASEGREVAARVREHGTAQGSRLCYHATRAGVSLILARVWENVPRYTEIKLKNRGGAARLCPLCRNAAVST